MAPVFNGLRSVDREEWARAFRSLAVLHDEGAAKAEASGESATARKVYLIAYDCYHVARYPAHFAFQIDWIVKAQRGEYPFEWAETLACAFGRSTGEEWVEYAPELSLLDQGILDEPCAPLLCVNGVNDSVFPITDMHRLLAHGDPKWSRFYPGGHMGGGNSQAVIVQWLKEKLSA